MTSKNNRAPPLYYIKLCASFQIHRWIKTEVTVPKRSIRVKIGDFLSRVTLEFDGWPWKTLGHLFYTTSSFVHHFKAMGEFKLMLQSGNAQFGSKSAIFCPVWPWNLTDDLEQGKFEGFESCDRPIVRKRPIWVKIGDVFVPCDLEIWWMTLENNRASLLCCFKLCATFHSHWWIQTGVTVRKSPIWVKFHDF